MIQANELRIGSIVLYSDHKHYVINGFINNKVNLKRGNHFISCGIEDIQPIALTPEILEKSEFVEYYKSEWQLKFEHKDFVEFSVVFKQNRVLFIKGDTYLRELEFLHQLQNLYFSLTGNELEINI